jgi:ribosomal protein L12E/L44/L45/RPP1/RPP2
MAAEGEVNMKIDPARAKSLVQALQEVSERVASRAKGRNVSIM